MPEIILPEEWRPVVGFPSYDISNWGRSRSRRRQSRNSGPAKLLKPRPSSDGYLWYAFYEGGQRRDFAAHALVLNTFVGPPFGDQECRHIDGNKRNNRVDNLAWGDRVEQSADKRQHGTLPQGTDYRSAKLTEARVEQMRLMHAEQGIGHKRLAKMFGVGKTVAQRVLVGEDWKHAPGPIRAVDHQRRQGQF